MGIFTKGGDSHFLISVEMGRLNTGDVNVEPSLAATSRGILQCVDFPFGNSYPPVDHHVCAEYLEEPEQKKNDFRRFTRIIVHRSYQQFLPFNGSALACNDVEFHGGAR